MIAKRENSKHRYEQFEGTRQWSLLDRALHDLAENRDLEEKMQREYIVGFLCQALAGNEMITNLEDVGDANLAYVRSSIAKAQAMMRQANPNRESMARELMAERRREAASE